MPRPTIPQIIKAFIDQAGTPDPQFKVNPHGNVHLGSLSSAWGNPSGRFATLYSYGSHFPVVTLMPDGDGPRGWWLLNGDTFPSQGYHAGSTARHQEETRDAIADTGMDSMTVSFAAMNQAGIKIESVRIVHVLDEIHAWRRRAWDYTYREPSDWDKDDPRRRNWEQDANGKWSYEIREHHLGSALFTADYHYTTRVPGYYDFNLRVQVPPVYTDHDGTAYFLSAFDAQEPGFGLYFLCQLPAGVYPTTVQGALELLKPAEVTEAEHHGVVVKRQGDVFMIKSDYTTRELPGPSKRSAYVLGVSHMATEVRIDGMGNTYARGRMRHRPTGNDRNGRRRRPEHLTVVMGDAITPDGWWLVVKNTVPVDAQGNSRAWTIDNGRGSAVD